MVYDLVTSFEQRLTSCGLSPSQVFIIIISSKYNKVVISRVRMRRYDFFFFFLPGLIPMPIISDQGEQ